MADEDDNRTERIELRLTPKEKARLLRGARITGEGVSGLLRRAGLLEADALVARSKAPPKAKR